MRWAEFEQQQPHLAAVGRQRLIGPGVLLVATIRRDGTPRLSPVEPFVMDGDLLLAMLWQSRKATDLMRDPRVLVHSIVTSRDGGEGEFKLRGTAQSEDDPLLQHRYATSVAANLGWQPESGKFHLFSIDIVDVVYIRYDDATGDQFLTAWPPGRESVRRGTSATSVGGAEPRHELLVSD
jgi:hypothetical protein